MKIPLLAILFSALAFSQVPALQSAVPLPTPKVQLLDASGRPCAGCYLWTYAAGTSTLQATYTDSTAGTSNTNPVVLDAGGAASIWIGAQSYKLVLERPPFVAGHGSVVWTVDNVTDTTFFYLTYLRSISDAALLTYTPPFTGGVQTTVRAKLGQTVSVTDYGAVCDGTIGSSTATDDAAAFQLALDAMTLVHGTVNLPPGKVCGISTITMRPYVTLDLQGSTIQKVGSSTDAIIKAPNTGAFNHNVRIRNGILIGKVAVAHNGIDLRFQAATTGAIENIHVAHCGGVGIYLYQANVFALRDVWVIGNAQKNLSIESSNDIYAQNVTAETNNPAVTATLNIEVKNSQNIVFTNVHGELSNTLPVLSLNGVAHYMVDNLIGYYFTGGGTVTVPVFVDISNGSRGTLRYVQCYVYDGTITLTDLVKDDNGISWSDRYPGYAVTKTGFAGLGAIRDYSRQADTSYQWGNLLMNTPSPASNLPNNYWAIWFPHGTSFFGDESSANASAWITSNIRRKSDNSGFDLLDSSKPGWITRMGEGPEYFQIVRTPAGTYSPFTLYQIESSANGFRTFQQAANGQNMNFHEWRDYLGVPKVAISKDFALYTQARFPNVAVTSGDYTVGATEEIVTCDATASTATITLPSAVTASRRQITVKRLDASANTCSIVAAAGNVENAASYSLSAFKKYATFFSDGANWWLIANN